MLVIPREGKTIPNRREPCKQIPDSKKEHWLFEKICLAEWCKEYDMKRDKNNVFKTTVKNLR